MGRKFFRGCINKVAGRKVTSFITKICYYTLTWYKEYFNQIKMIPWQQVHSFSLHEINSHEINSHEVKLSWGQVSWGQIFFQYKTNFIWHHGSVSNHELMQLGNDTNSFSTQSNWFASTVHHQCSRLPGNFMSRPKPCASSQLGTAQSQQLVH